LAGIVLEGVQLLFQFVKLIAEIAFMLVLKPVMTESQLKTTKSASMIARDLRMVGIVRMMLTKSQIVQHNVGILKLYLLKKHAMTETNQT